MYKILLTYDLHIRSTDPRFHLVSQYKNIFRSHMKNDISYKLKLTVSHIPTRIWAMFTWGLKAILNNWPQLNTAIMAAILRV